MKAKTELAIDKNLVKPFVWLLNILVRIAGKIFRPKHDLTKQFRTIAICKYKGIGSIIQATPLLQTLRKKYPDAKIIFVTSRGNEKFLQLIPAVDEVISIDDKNFSSLARSFFPFLFKLMRRKISLFIDLEIYSNFSTLVTTLSLSRNRFGYYMRDDHYRMGCHTHMLFYNIQHPIAETYLQFARLLHCNEIISDLWNFGNVSDESFFSNQSLKDFHNKEFLLINPNASDLRLERRWSGENFISLAEKISEWKSNIIIGFIGSNSEKEYVSQLLSKIKHPKNIFNLAGATNFTELLGLLRNAKLFITNDTGPMHIGMALHTRTIALFGPCSPAQYGNHSLVKNFYKHVYCSPCVHEFATPPCNGNNVCMKMISVEEVFLEMKNQWSNSSSSNTETTDDIIYSDTDENVLGLVKRS